MSLHKSATASLDGLLLPAAENSQSCAFSIFPLAFFLANVSWEVTLQPVLLQTLLDNPDNVAGVEGDYTQAPSVCRGLFPPFTF